MAQAFGRILHLSERGIVAKCSSAPKLGEPVLDRRKKRIGNVADIFGPVHSPYILIKPASGLSAEEKKALVNSDIYMGEEKHGREKRK
ncbi:MAG: H/ACA ribonucleoprotein complex subunit GAR1 [Candidatus Hadarchaeales archaeon]